MKYLISYDVHGNEDERKELEKWLRQFGAFSSEVTTTWIFALKDNVKIVDLFNALKNAYPHTDFLVAEIGMFYDSKLAEVYFFVKNLESSVLYKICTNLLCCHFY